MDLSRLTAEKLYDDSRIKDAGTLEDLFGRRSLDESGTPNRLRHTAGLLALLQPQAHGLQCHPAGRRLVEGDEMGS